MLYLICHSASCYICHKTLTKSCILSDKGSGSALYLNVLLYFTLKNVLTKDIPLKFNTFIKQLCFLDKNVSTEPGACKKRGIRNNGIAV